MHYSVCTSEQNKHDFEYYVRKYSIGVAATTVMDIICNKAHG